MKNLFYTSFIVLFLWVGCSSGSGSDEGQSENCTSEISSIQWGVNIHDGGPNPELWANELSMRNLKHVRMDYWGLDDAYVDKFRKAVIAMDAKGIVAQAIVFTDFSEGQKRDKDYNADLVEVEETAYQSAKTQVLKITDLILEYELQNEIPLYGDMNKDGSTGENASDYDTPAGRLQVAVLKGMSRAIDDVRKSSGLPLRIIIGTVDRRFGFIKKMQEEGVIFDIVGYHIYP